ncbi:MAG: YeiH family putative sulfate export transporter [Bacteroidaceae bacterium]|nr:YeiH family putative sulfate export transporter [Bacteroidaceae bacterium]MCF0186559.1 YeiH family putative sulfate export transporter [Bacteroidaceae bacterium]
MKTKEFYYGIVLMAAFSLVAFAIASLDAVKALSFSPLIVGIILGMVYANTWRSRLPQSWTPGLKFCTKQILRTGIVLYGFRLTLTEVMAVGWPAIVVDCIVIIGTIGLGILLGRAMKMDSDTALITSTGSAICGAAAVLGAEPVVKCEPHKTAIAVSTVVIFGTLSMFLYPILYRAGLFDALDNTQVAIYTGSTLHEVAHVAGAGNAMDPTDALGIAGAATITKMIRVIMLAPVLIIMAFCLKGRQSAQGKAKITIPWFAINFILVIILNTFIQQADIERSLASLVYAKGSWMELFDTFCLTMAMTALGADTSIDKFRQAGAKPFYLAGGLYVWLVCGGYLLARYLVPLL